MRIRFLVVPEEIPQDEVVIVTAIKVESGAHVQEGDHILDIETSKTAYQISAQSAGVLKHELGVGDEVSSGDNLGEIIETK